MDDTAKVLKFEPAPTLKNDRKLWVSVGKSRFDKKWKNRQMSWSAILQRLANPIRTPETHAEYMKMTRADQDQTKDVGGFVGGVLRDGKRSARTVTSRTILAFDLDQAPEGFWEDYSLLVDYAAAVYSTHKHSPEKPRLRLLVPLSRDVSADEYEAVARMLATDIGMDFMDPSTFQPSRLMYWPSVSDDGQYIFKYVDMPFLDPDRILARYPDWTDASTWPMSPKEVGNHKTLAARQQDPTTKTGIVGAFCRTYDIPDAIAAFLSDVYTPTDKPDRYTYAAGSTSAGLVIYEDGAFAFSNHGTDPAGGQLCNSFDLVRIHKFGGEDEDVPGDTPTTKRPSYRAMVDFATKDLKVLALLDEEREAASDFDDDGDKDENPAADRKKKDEKEDDWKKDLIRDKNGAPTKKVRNAVLVFQNDKRLQGLAFNQLSNAIDVRGTPLPWKRQPGPWRDSDDAQLVTWVSEHYAEFSRQTIMDQKVITADRHAFHPVKEYLENLPDWDGVARADTLLIDYLGAEDNVFTREATAKILTAAVRRIYEPGCKFDSMLVLSGPPNTGKSMLVARLGGKFFSDNLTFEDMKDKTAAEKLQGYWLLEIGEMKGMRKMDVESIKAFVSRQEDIYRAAYGRNTERHPRQCVIFGTVNDLSGYLKDVTGNRRFWPVEITGQAERHPWDLTKDIIDQIWAEIFFRYRDLGESDLILSPEAAKIAEEKQTEALESDDREGIVEEYLYKKLPKAWGSMKLTDRLSYLDGDTDLLDEDEKEGVNDRQYVSNIEIWCECFRQQPNRIQKRDSYEIAGILKRLGWERVNDRKHIALYGLVRLYKRPKYAGKL